MRISTRGRYSLEALLFLTLLPKGSSASTRAISEKTGISDGYLEQLFIPLKKNNIITGIRGPQGGYFLNLEPDHVSVGSILRITEGSLEPVACLSQGTCPAEQKCISRHTWNDLYHEITDCVDSITLADLAGTYSFTEEEQITL
jgi:Rrf2 family protein